MSEAKKLNIYQKLIEIRKSCQYLQKEEGGRFAYAKESSVISAIRPKMDELGVLLTIDMYEVSTADKIVTASFRFTFINAENPNETVVSNVILQDLAGSPQKLGGLATYATRYGLTRAFLIPQDNLDPDAFKEKINGPQTLNKEQVESIKSLCEGRHDIMAQVVKHAPDGRLENLTANRYTGIAAFITKQLEVK